VAQLYPQGTGLYKISFTFFIGLALSFVSAFKYREINELGDSWFPRGTPTVRSSLGDTGRQALKELGLVSLNCAFTLVNFNQNWMKSLNFSDDCHEAILI
jgi:hypothetical protein